METKIKKLQDDLAQLNVNIFIRFGISLVVVGFLILLSSTIADNYFEPIKTIGESIIVMGGIFIFETIASFFYKLRPARYETLKKEFEIIESIISDNLLEEFKKAKKLKQLNRRLDLIDDVAKKVHHTSKLKGVSLRYYSAIVNAL